MDDKSFHIRIPKKWMRISLVIAATALVVAPLSAIASHPGGFDDVPDSNIFHDDIEWLKEADVTRGCNPPANTLYCPSDNVTREQMAAFMKRLAENQVVDAATALEAENASNLGGKPAGAYAENLWASVNTNGTLARGAGVVSSELTGFTGSYEVIFDRDVRDCSYVATIGNPGSGTPAPGQIVTARRFDQPNGVFVRTHNATGDPTNRSFHLMVMCGATTVATAEAGASDPEGGN